MSFKDLEYQLPSLQHLKGKNIFEGHPSDKWFWPIIAIVIASESTREEATQSYIEFEMDNNAALTERGAINDELKIYLIGHGDGEMTVSRPLNDYPLL